MKGEDIGLAILRFGFLARIFDFNSEHFINSVGGRD
jgi:hypothetical protein